ncbi:regulator of ribonuclease activity A [Cupriavidus gilardii J11]|uniref:4-hydroxy-4-methyl-2-oxoglutarate aldolase n=1 Tax=Cupriavidus gilardii J11 TaxID=936133 RepID=A0A562BIJ2_9BURK|nr:ribonuclease E activity regulator RraA [Cupriavidus gilardii]TWG84976.1 regulator of ribonuclease activity A [Cupriavidus gilardii J11]
MPAFPCEPTSDLADRHGERVRGYCSPFASYGGRTVFFGPIETLRSIEDPKAVRACLAEPGNGRVLVVDAGGSLRAAVLGDNMARLAHGNGWAGVVIHGAVRDRDGLSSIDIGVLALGTVPIRASAAGPAQRGGTIAFLGMEFVPGSYFFCDADGILLADGPLPP